MSCVLRRDDCGFVVVVDVDGYDLVVGVGDVVDVVVGVDCADVVDDEGQGVVGGVVVVGAIGLLFWWQL